MYFCSNVDVFLSHQAAVTSSTGTQCLLAVSSVRWSCRTSRPHLTSMTTTSPEDHHLGHDPNHHLHLLMDVQPFFLSGGGSHNENLDKLFEHHLFHQTFFRLNMDSIWILAGS